MLELLAQTTQPAAWRTWTVADWVTLIGAISGAVVLILNTWYSRRGAIAAETNQASRSDTDKPRIQT